MKRIVVIGGGTGAYTALRGLKNYTSELTAVVSMFDSGGSTGLLRDEYGYLPPGDVRRCILALAPETENKKILRELLSYRFPRGLSNHNFGNLWLTALKEIIGNEVGAIEYLSSLFGVQGRVLPVTLDNSTLCAELSNGEIIRGETNIDIPKHDGSLSIKKLFLEPSALAYVESVNAINDADLVVLGPGDLFTSILPNLLVNSIPEAIRNSKAKKILVCNVMSKWGETHNFTTAKFIEEVEKYLGMSPDFEIVNTRFPSGDMLEKYAKERAFPIKIESHSCTKIIEADLLNEKEILRHDSAKLARVIMSLA